MQRPTRAIVGVVGAVALVFLMAHAAQAASPHFQKGGVPVCSISGSTTSKSVACTGILAGLGNEDLNLHLAVSGVALYQCQNGGGNTAPGQNRVLEGPASSDTAIPASAIKNGNLTFTTNPATLTAAPTVSGAAAGCPNPNWTGVNPALTVTDITLDIFQPVTTQIFHCTASNPNGLSSPVTLAC
jgi:hypothetical protein